MTDNVFDLADRRLAWLDRRQEVLAQNIANANTPGYRPRDLTSFSDQLRSATFSVTPWRTSALDLRGLADAQSGGMHDVAGETAIDGNGVAVESELTKVAQTDADQTLVTDLYKKYLGLFRTALGR